MKLLFLSKRYPMGKDLLDQPYGRFRHLPELLAGRGHEVHVLLLDYGRRHPEERTRNGVSWQSEPLVSRRGLPYLERAGQLAGNIRPDWVIGFSDTYFGILARHIAGKHHTRFCIDAYDNYESYISWLKPLHWQWRRALADADLVTAAGPALAQLMSRQRPDKRTLVVPMSADPTGFQPMDRLVCRQYMQLPLDRKLVGYFGSVHKSRGIGTLFQAMEKLENRHPDVQLVLSGRYGRGVSIPASALQLGYIEDSRMPMLINSMDTIAVINRPSAFGNYSYPVKLYEAMCCQVPVATTQTPATAWILESHPQFLSPPSDPDSLYRLIARNLDMGRVEYGITADWNPSCDILERAMLEMG